MDKDSIKSRVRRETVMMLIFGISGWIILIMFFYSLDRRSARREEEKETREEELNQMVKEYLENKYGENFMLEEPSYVSGSRWYGTGSGSPIPGMEGGTESGDPMYCYAYAESNMGFRFRVYVYPESLEKNDFDSMDVIKEENELFSGYNIETPFWESAIWNLEMDKIFEDEVDNIYN